MVRKATSPSRVVAVLGPTNTGKTHFATERMLAHRSGMMGFPLRLLAREVYDRIVAIRGRQAVCLITGEERTGPADAPYLVATVEAMPLHRAVDFLAIDEIQLCADFERGHIFTDRLLEARGISETMFLGSDTIRSLLKRLVPEAEIVTRPRFSTLSHAGPIKLNRLPRRSAVVAFTAAEVYGLAEVLRRQKGGAAVVLGALSPRTRNAQVALYQSGEVDHLVATDAIGMGLNMDLQHVAFAALHKFDGRESRRLAAPEVAQIAGRAGRHMSDGTFGPTDGCPELDERLVDAVETHSFAPLKKLRWRSSSLDFASVEALRASLEAPPPDPALVKVRDALDDRSLAMLARRDVISARADCPERVRLLWQVCQIPDFRKTLTEAHLHLLSHVFKNLTEGRGVLANDWMARMVGRQDRTDGDIDALVTRISHVRTLTYLSHRAEWHEDPLLWQGRTREVEDRLSDALHERLTQRFVDRRTAQLMRSLREDGLLPAAVEPGGEVVVDGHLVGRVDGLSFSAERGDADIERRVLAAAARKTALPELRARAARLGAAADEDFALDDADRIRWRGDVVARLAPGPEALRPRVLLQVSSEIGVKAMRLVEARLERWLESWIAGRLGPLLGLREAARDGALAAPARGLAYRLYERLGSISRAEAEQLMRELCDAGRRRLTRLGVRYGRLVLYVPQLLKPAAVGARARLLRLAAAGGLALPAPGRTVLRARELDGIGPDDVLMCGFLQLGGVALRQDIAERLAAGVRARARSTDAFALPVELAAEAGLSRSELEAVLAALGYRNHTETATGNVRWIADERRRRSEVLQRRQARHPAVLHSPFAALAALKVAR